MMLIVSVGAGTQPRAAASSPAPKQALRWVHWLRARAWAGRCAAFRGARAEGGTLQHGASWGCSQGPVASGPVQGAGAFSAILLLEQERLLKVWLSLIREAASLG